MKDLLKLKRILVATDFLESSRLALEYAIAFARHFGASIILLHVLELEYAAQEMEAETSRPSMTRKAAQKRLETIAEEVRNSRIAVDTLLLSGIPSDVILTSIGTQNADLLVLGIHGTHRGLMHLLIGSNTEKIFLSATCPTMTVGAHVLTGFNPALQFKEILLFTDSSSTSAMVSAYASFFSKKFNAPVDICELAAKNSLGPEPIAAEVVCGSSHPSAGQLGARKKPNDLEIDPGKEATALLGRARNYQAGFIILEVHAEASLVRHFHTSLAYRLLAEANCPVISVRTRPKEE